MIRTIRSIFVVAVTLALAISAAAEAKTWQIDPNHTAAQFSVRHLGISTVRGAFTKVSGSATYDAADLSKTTIEATIDATSIDTRVERRDNDLRGPNYFDVAKYPTITFKSKKVEAAGAGKLKMTGDLTIHGVTKEVVLDGDGPSEPVTDAHGNTHVGASATTKIRRHDFGVNGGGGAVGEEVSITLDVELVSAAPPPAK